MRIAPSPSRSTRSPIHARAFGFSTVLGLLLSLITWMAHAQSPIVIETVNDLRTINASAFTNDTVAYVIDYWTHSSLGNRGGGHFRWLTPGSATDDGGRFITNSVNTNGVWERVLDGGTPNVKMWGAYGDGSHDDTIAIQNAINGCQGWASGEMNVGELLFPDGTYAITNTLIFNGQLLHIRGENPEHTIVQMTLGYSADIFQTWSAHLWLAGTNGDFDHGLLFENLRVAFQDDGSTNGHPLRNTNNAGLVLGMPGEVSTIRNVEFVNGGFGIRCLGGGAPGLNLRDVKCTETAIAGILIEPLPGESGYDVGGPINIIGLSGDQNYGDVASNASLVVISNVDSLISISSIKAEADWGGGLIHYYCGADDFPTLEHLVLRECNYNAGMTGDGKWFPPDFLKIDASPLFYGGFGPVVTIEQVRLNSVANLINDSIGDRIVESDDSGLNQLTAMLPITYQANQGGSGLNPPTWQFTGSSLLVGETAISTFYATNTGWYRIMAPYGDGSGSLAGRVSITSQSSLESIEMQVDCTQGATPWINVTRCKTGVAVVSQARAIATTYPWSYVDIYVSNAIPASAGVGARLTVALDTQGVQRINNIIPQLLSPIVPVSATPPPGSTVTTVNTYR